MTKSKNKNSSDILMGVLLTIVIAIIPLVCKLDTVPIRADEINTIRTGTGHNDIFSYTKSILLMCMGVVTAIFLAFDIFSEENMTVDFRSLPVILIGSYILLSFISALFSGYMGVAFLGATERYEGFFIWLCYFVFFISAMAYSSDKKRAKFLLLGFMLSGLLLGIIGILQILDVPVFENTFVSKLIMGDSYKGTNLKIKFDSVFATLYNPNCAGLYFGMISSLFIVLSVFLPVKSKFKYASIVIAVIAVISTIGTSSVGGFLGLIFAVMFTAVVAACYFIFKKKSKIATILSIVSIFILIVAGILFINSDAVIAQKTRIIIDAVTNGKTIDSSNNFYKDITIEENKGNIMTANGIYTIKADKDNTVFLHNDIEMKPVSTEPSTENGGLHHTFKEDDLTWDLYLYEDEAIYNISLISTDSKGNAKYFMMGQIDDNLSFLDKFGNVVDINEEVPSIGFEGVERLGSNRGYIWSRSLPCVLDNLIIGAGPDCFEFEFPQYDIKSKLIYLNDPYVIIDKPHNMFLQFAINTGLISLLVMLALFILYIIQTIKSVFNDNDNFTIALKLGIMAGVVAYLIAGFTTDSIVSVAPVFWTLLGMGFGVNLIGKTKSKEEREIERIKKKLK